MKNPCLYFVLAVLGFCLEGLSGAALTEEDFQFFLSEDDPDSNRDEKLVDYLIDACESAEESNWSIPYPCTPDFPYGLTNDPELEDMLFESSTLTGFFYVAGNPAAPIFADYSASSEDSIFLKFFYHSNVNSDTANLVSEDGEDDNGLRASLSGELWTVRQFRVDEKSDVLIYVAVREENEFFVLNKIEITYGEDDEEPDPTELTTDPTQPTTDPTEPNTDPTEPTTDPTQPTTDPTEPNTDPTQPTTDPTEPNTDPTEPTTDPTQPTTDPTQPTTDPTEPNTDPTQPTTDPTQPTTDPTEPNTDPTQPTTDPTQPTTDPTEPNTDPTQPTTDPTQPTTDPTQPNTDPTQPNTDPTQPTTDPTEPSPISSSSSTTEESSISEEEDDSGGLAAYQIVLIAVGGTALVGAVAAAGVYYFKTHASGGTGEHARLDNDDFDWNADDAGAGPENAGYAESVPAASVYNYNAPPTALYTGDPNPGPGHILPRLTKIS